MHMEPLRMSNKSYVCNYCDKCFSSRQSKSFHQKNCRLRDFPDFDPLVVRAKMENLQATVIALTEEVKRLSHDQVNASRKVAYIYMVCLEDNTIKVGMTIQNSSNVVNRIKNYPKESKIKFVIEVPLDSVRDIERELLSILKEKFELAKGREFFKGDEKVMATTALSYIMDYIND